ncbi:MAG: hypothetical protein SGJ11_09255 [Phycisphaerae bacterium]|nr:hypothetical protein [Phycisphaerae bacterium]
MTTQVLPTSATESEGLDAQGEIFLGETQYAFLDSLLVAGVQRGSCRDIRLEFLSPGASGSGSRKWAVPRWRVAVGAASAYKTQPCCSAA